MQRETMMARSDHQTLSSPARRHFLAATTGLAGRLISAATLAATLAPSIARAERGGWGKGHDSGRGLHGGDGHGDDGRGGPNCFLPDTRILMQDGETRIADIRIGDLIVTGDGHLVPVKWIGRNIFRKNGQAWPERVIPIRVSRSAIADGVPHDDLYLSSGHALYLDGYLIPVRELVNGRSIAPAPPAAANILEYYQVVLAAHHVISAEGLLVESFLARNRTEIEKFTNFVEYRRLYPNDVGPMVPYAVNLGTRFAHLTALFGVGMSYLTGSSNPLDRAYERIASRAAEAIT